MPHFDSDYEAKLYQDRADSLERIKQIGTARLGLSQAAATYPSTFRFAPEGITIPRLRLLGLHADGTEKTAEELEAEPIEAALAGRVMAHRAQGKAGFAQLQGGDLGMESNPAQAALVNNRLQIYVRKDDVGEDAFALYKELHIGDLVGVRGRLMRTRTGELTLKVQPTVFTSIDHGVEGQSTPINKNPLVFLAKAMLALPDKYHGLEDVELRYRQRYVDLIMNSGTSALPSSGAIAPPAAGDATHPVAVGTTPSPRAGSGVSPAPSSLSFRSAAEVSASPGAPSPSTEADTPLNVREVFVKRAAILRAIRRFFDERGYLEVETPMMHTVAGGAAARPFKTHHNALDLSLSLRIAPELFLKRLVVGGLDRVYEINRNFRNEGIDTQHNPEFTMLEFYQAYADYHDLMDLTQELIQFVAIEVNGTTKTVFNGVEIDLAVHNWQKLSMREAIVEFWPEHLSAAPTEAEFAEHSLFSQKVWNTYEKGAHLQEEDEKAILPAEEFEIEAVRRLDRSLAVNMPFGNSIALAASDADYPFGKLVAEVFEALAEPHLIQPTIIYDFPLAVSPLSKPKPDEPDWVERFEFYIGGFEVGNAFSELNDPEDQQRRFEDQLKEKERGDDEAHAMDEDYVRALGFGLPPTGGEGHRHRPTHHAAHRQPLHSRRYSLPPAPAAGRRRETRRIGSAWGTLHHRDASA